MAGLLAIEGARTYGNEDELGLAGAEGLKGAAVAQHNLTRLDDEGKLIRLSVKERRIIEGRNGPWRRWTGRRTWTSWGPLRRWCGLSKIKAEVGSW